MDFQEYIKPELLGLIPALYLIGMGLKKSAMPDKWIPAVLGIVSVVLCSLYLLATGSFAGWQDIAVALFTAITQGVLSAGASVYVNQIEKQAWKPDDNKEE